MALERRFLTAFRKPDDDHPGLIQEDDQSVWVVLPDGTRVEIDGSGVSSLVDLSDVDPSGLGDGDVPTWDGAAAEFRMQVGTPGATGSTGPAGGGGAGILEYQLDADTAAGATSVVLERSPSTPVYLNQLLVVDAYTSQAEIRRITAVAGDTVTVSSALTYAHAANDFAVVIESGAVTTSMWGCRGDGTVDDTVALQEALYQTSSTIGGSGLWLDGQNKTHAVTAPLVALSPKLRHIKIAAKTSYAPAEANNAMVMSTQGSIVAFTADASTDVITTASAHGIPADGTLVMFKGAALPGGLVNGKIYYVYNRAATTFKVSATVGGAIVDITSAGSGGTAYCEINSLEKAFLDDVHIQGHASIPTLNGASFYLQQPAFTNKLRIDNCTGTCLRLNGQISNHYNMELNGVTTGDGVTCLDLRGNGHNFFGLNMVHGTDGVTVVAGQSALNCHFFGLWTENITNHIHFLGSHSGITFNGWYPSLGGGTQDGLVVDAGVSADNSSYMISGLRVSTSQAIVADASRSLTLYQTDFPQSVLALYVQPAGAVGPWVPTPVPVGTTSDYAIKTLDRFIRIGNATVPRTATLPSAVGLAGNMKTIKRTLAGAAITVATTGGQTIDGAATYVLAAQYDVVSVVSNGANWEIV